jgi:hypothetical protein
VNVSDLDWMTADERDDVMAREEYAAEMAALDAWCESVAIALGLWTVPRG